MTKRVKKSNCDDCKWYACDSTRKAYICGVENKMTFNEFEDYFVDRIVACPYYEKKAEENNGD